MRFIVCFLGLILSAFVYADAPPASDTPPPVFTLTTNAFLDAGALPVLYTCDDKDVSPELSWTNPPAKTQAFALIIEDPVGKLDKKYQWVVYDLPANTAELTEGLTNLPAGAMTGKNSYGKTNYMGPCPPKGSVNTYSLTLYALNQKLALPANTDAESVQKAIQAHTVQKAAITMVYSRWP